MAAPSFYTFLNACSVIKCVTLQVEKIEQR